MKKIAKKIASQLHLWLGVSSGLVVFIVALTGCLLVFEEELEPVINKPFHIVQVPKKANRLPLDNLTAIASNAFPANKLSRIIIEKEEERTVLFGFGLGKKEKEILTVAVNPYTGKIVAAAMSKILFLKLF